MNILIVGGGGREHALAWKVSQSPKLTKLYVAPGNVGMSDIATLVDIKVEDIDGIVKFAVDNDIKMVLIGPEVPLQLGLADVLKEKGIMVMGPCGKGAEIEGSKALSKDLMIKYGVPTGDYKVFTNQADALEYLKTAKIPIVVKADGLAAGKGVIIATTREMAENVVRDIMENNIFGDAGNRVVIEEFLEGEEVSVLAFTDGKTVIPMISSQDHKRIFDNDEGPNTGGMGAYSPAPVYTEEINRIAVEEVLKPIIAGLEKEGRFYQGVIYAGLMVTNNGVEVLEFNARFGDPETQGVLMLLDTDLVDIVEAINQGRLAEMDIKWKDKSAVCVVISAENYPASPVKGDVINGLDLVMEDTMVFHAGTKKDGDNIVTNGGRVLGVTALGTDIKDALERAYNRVNTINFRGMHYRKDIGYRALNRK